MKKPSKLEEQVLRLAPEQRARLAAKLLESLETLSDAESERVWAEEASRRDAELDSGIARPRAAKAVFRAARARLK